MLVVTSLPHILHPETNFFILWGAVNHSNQSDCLHRPQDPHFPLPNQLTYVAFLKDSPESIVTERSPKWNIRDDATLSGNGYYGVEVGNLPTAFSEPSKDLTIAMTCYGAGEQAVVTTTLPRRELAAHTSSILLTGDAIPNYPPWLEVIRKKKANNISWDGTSDLKYDVYRADLTDTLADGRPKRSYHRVAAGVDTDAFTDPNINSSHRYGYLLIAEDPRGARSGHSVEVVDVPDAPGPIEHLAAFTNGHVAVSYAGGNSVTIMTADGTTIKSFVTGPKRWFAIDLKDQLWVLTSSVAGSLVVTIYSSRGEPKESTVLPRATSPEGAIRGIAVDKDRQLWILSQGGILVYDRKLRPRGASRFDDTVTYPTSLAVRGNRLAVADAVGRQILFYRHEKKTIRGAGHISTGPLEPWGLDWLSANELAVSAPFEKSLSIYHTNERIVRSLKANVVGSFRSPRGVGIRKRQIYTADDDRIVILPAKPDPESWEPEVTFGTAGQASLTWQSAVPSISEVKYWLEDGVKQVVATQGMRKHHQLNLTDLPPVTRINYMVSTPIRTIPQTRWTTPFDFATPLWAPGQTAVLRLPLAVILHTHAVGRDTVPAGAPPLLPIPPSEVARIGQQVDDAVLFYWHNTRMKVFLDVDFFTNTAYRDVAPFGEEPAPDLGRVAAFLKTQDHQLSEYVGILRIIAEQQYDDESGVWKLAGRGGGLYHGH